MGISHWFFFELLNFMEKPNIGLLKIAMVQTDLFWKGVTANLAMLEEKIWTIDQQVDLIVLPEMFSTGFTMDAAEMAEPMNFTTCKWMKQMAAQTNAVLTGSIIIKENSNYYNRLLWVTPEGHVSWYDKRHLFRMAEEDQSFSMGLGRITFDLKGWKVFPQICYDLRFPVWTRNRMENGSFEYDLVLFVANWPSPRINAWDILLKARAVENLSYAIGVNRVGQDGNGIPYSGHSGAYDFKGAQIAFSEIKEEILIVELDHQELEHYREKFPAWKDADDFDIRS
ncbi:hypothetical protein P872_13230 [Rhodonellum psychrophilum GCM71 = DSM 17998]|uniref:Omega-amidase YafV n=3 Tax=Cytophagaceae TaxID=89373 RepID=U5BJB6_9BACT|nr:hypothetical protein P872_13230 [Rhodonellum psychrophilum GCM71 = DSM 17998]SDY97600.1 Predicted amidohydrolase [Rhodonellum ikkaensis]